MRFYTKILKELPRDYLNDMQVKFISKFYIDRLKDNHRVVPPVIEGYSVLIDMSEYNIQNCTDFLTILFREVTCQSQTRQDRYNIYVIIQKLCNKDIECEYDFLYCMHMQLTSKMWAHYAGRDVAKILRIYQFNINLIYYR